MNQAPIRWSSSLAFVFAAAAAAVGLGNIWRFPYLVGENGGGAFVLVYLACVIILGIPLMMSEVFIGRIGRKNASASFMTLAKQAGRSRYWGLVGLLSVIASFLILSYYVVIGGWVLDYFWRAVLGQFNHITEISSQTTFTTIQNNFAEMLLTDTLLIAASIAVIILGIKKGLERTVKFLFPALLVLMLILIGNSIIHGEFSKAATFLFKPDFHQLTGKTVLIALGQAFFSLNIAMGITITFSAYLPEKSAITKTVIAITIADTLVALLAGLVIFPIVFGSGLVPSAGPGLIFITLPIALSQLPFSYPLGVLFFLMLLFAAFTSAIALLEVFVFWLMEKQHLSRTTATLFAGFTCWLLSLGTIASFANNFQLPFMNFNFFTAIDSLTSSIMLPLGGLFTALFTGWFLSARFISQQLDWNSKNFWFRLWRASIRFVAPVAIVLILFYSLGVFNHV